jgi:hypothetical protein
MASAPLKVVPGFFWARFQETITVVEVVPIRSRGNSIVSYVALVPGDAAPLSLEIVQLLDGPLVPPTAAA